MRLNPAAFRDRISHFTMALAALAMLMLVAGGCSRVPVIGKYFKGNTIAKSPIGIDLRLAQTSVRPGDAVLAYLFIRNVGSANLRVQMLDASSIDFYAAGPKSVGTIRVYPVVSSKESLGQLEEIKPGQYLPKIQAQAFARAFVFTTLTKEPGDYRLQAIYHPTPKGAPSDLAPVIAKAVAFQVAGPRSFNRDREGILLKDDAIEIAKRHVGQPVTAAEALLVEDEQMGFLLWKVVLTVDPKDLKPGERNPRSIFVNPYRAVVIQVGEPLAPAIPPPPGVDEGPRPPRPKVLPSPK
jgi:hypothetical protein